jgi:fumarate reductase flavoprotein subunit
MKAFVKFGVFVMAGLLALSLVAGCGSLGAPKVPSFTPGIYTARASGHNADFDVRVTFSESRIENIDFSGNSETMYLGTGSMEKVREAILQYQTVNVDTISGATVSTGALLAAVSDAVRQAGGNPGSLPKGPAPVKVSRNATTQVVVVGSGTAGLAAAVEASEQGLDVILIEQHGVLGGSSVRAGYFMAGGSRFQRERNSTYSEEDFVRYLTDVSGDLGGGNRAEIDQGLFQLETATRIARAADENIDWLDNLGIKMSVASGPNGNTIRGAGTDGPSSTRVGGYFVSAMHKVLDDRQIDYRVDTRAEEIIMRNGRAVGVRVTGPGGSSYVINADAVILATGGYNGNPRMIAQYHPAYAGYTSDVSKGADGSGMLMAEKAGGVLRYMDQTNFHSFTLRYRGASRNISMGSGAIAVNKEGRRFVNEDTYYDKSCCDSIVAQTGGVCYVILDQAIGNTIFTGADLANNPAMFQKADTLEELAGLLGINAATLVETVRTYNAAVESRQDREFNRRTNLRAKIENGPFYGVEAQPELHTDHGGVVVDIDNRVLNAQGNPIPGLYATGEVAATHIMGSITNTPALAHGRFAAQAIAAELKSR